MKIGIYPIDEKAWIDVGTLSSLNSGIEFRLVDVNFDNYTCKERFH